MAVNIIVIAVTLLMAGFVSAWLLFPSLRAWIETPKHRFLERQREYPDVLREQEPDKPRGHP